jgi:hypothetical protein
VFFMNSGEASHARRLSFICAAFISEAFRMMSSKLWSGSLGAPR